MAQNHNVDIRSTQLANAIKSIPDAFLALGTAGLIGAGIFGILVFTIIRPLMLNHEASLRKDAKQLNFSNLINDYQKNKARYRINWENSYVRFKGRIGKISSYSYGFAPQSVYLDGKRIDVQCTSVQDKPNVIAQYNPGNLISVIGKYDTIRDTYTGTYMIELDNCVIQ